MVHKHTPNFIAKLYKGFFVSRIDDMVGFGLKKHTDLVPASTKHHNTSDERNRVEMILLWESDNLLA